MTLARHFSVSTLASQSNEPPHGQEIGNTETLICLNSRAKESISGALGHL